MKRHALALPIVVMVLMFSLAAAGCSSSAGSSSQPSSSSASSASSSEAAPELKTVGDVSAGGAVIEFTNKAGRDITAIAVKPTGEGEYPASFLDAGDEIASGEAVELLCPKIPEADSNGSDVELKRLADISVTLSDGSAYELHQVDMYGIAQATLRVEGDIAYLEYTTEDGQSASTLESERAIAAQAAEEAAAAEAAAAEAEAAYEDDSSYADTATYVDDAAVGSGNEEACIDDIVLR